jgi:hypothetical protein
MHGGLRTRQHLRGVQPLALSKIERGFFWLVGRAFLSVEQQGNLLTVKSSFTSGLQCDRKAGSGWYPIHVPMFAGLHPEMISRRSRSLSMMPCGKRVARP